MKLNNIFKYPYLLKDRIHRRLLPSTKMKEVYIPSTGVTDHKYEVIKTEIRKHKPQRVLELGSGKTTYLIANELKKYGGKLVSIEENEKYYNEIKDLPDNVELCLSPKVEDSYMLFRGVRYNNIPKYEYDLVFIDGPTTSWKGEKTFDMDFIRVVQAQEKPVRAIVDSRFSTMFVLSLVFGNKVSIDYASEIGYVNLVTKSNMLNTNSMMSSIPMFFVKRR